MNRVLVMYSFFSSRASAQVFSEKRTSKSPGTLSSFHPTRAKKQRKHLSLPASAGAEMARRSHASSIVQRVGLAISAALSGKESGYSKEAWETLVL